MWTGLQLVWWGTVSPPHYPYAPSLPHTLPTSRALSSETSACAVDSTLEKFESMWARLQASSPHQYLSVFPCEVPKAPNIKGLPNGEGGLKKCKAAPRLQLQTV